VKDRFLDEIAGVQVVSSRGRQFAVGPALQLRHAALQQGLNRATIALLCPNDKLDRRLVAQEVRRMLVLGRWIGASPSCAHVMQAACNDTG
jgi:hypothetical protein